MSENDEQYIDGQLDLIQQAARAGDTAEVVRRINHLRSEGDPTLADILTRKLAERGVAEFITTPPPPTYAPTPTHAPMPSPPARKSRMWLVAAISLALGAAIAIAVTVPVMRLSIDTATTVTVSPTAQPTSPVPPPVPVATGPGQQAPTATPPAANAPVYSDLPLTLAPQSCDVYHPAIDFDEPKVFDNYSDGGYKTADLWYETCVGTLQQRAGAFIGHATDIKPAPRDCALTAKTQQIGSLNVRTLKVGQAFCVLTSDNQVAWVKVVDKGEPQHRTLNDGPIPTIKLVATLWRSI